MSSSPLPLIPEFLPQICANISHRPSLARLARTCKAFEHPALEILWKDLNGFYNLAKCLPENLVREFIREPKSRQGTRSRVIVLREPLKLTTGDCERLIRYAEMVNTFQFFQRKLDEYLVDISVFEGLDRVLQTATLFPNIQRLMWATEEEGMLPFVHLLAGPRLRAVDVTAAFNNTSINPVSIFPTLPVHSNDLVEVFFNTHMIRVASPDPKLEKEEELVISESLCDMQHWNNLERLHVPNLTCDAVLRLSQLPHLEELAMTRWKPDPEFPAIKGAGFASLRNLLFSTVDINAAISLLEMMNSTPLRILKVIFTEAQDGNSYRRLCDTIKDHLNHEKLFMFTSTDVYGRHTPSDPRPLTFEDIKPLLAFHNLNYLSMELTYGAYFSGAGITQEMASNWRNIETIAFKLAFGRRSPIQSTITLTDLIPFASCPNLEYLDLFFDAHDPPIDDLLEVPGTSKSKLYALGVNDSPANDHLRISAFLKKYFPMLGLIETCEHRDYGPNEEDDGREMKKGNAFGILLKVCWRVSPMTLELPGSYKHMSVA